MKFIKSFSLLFFLGLVFFHPLCARAPAAENTAAFNEKDKKLQAPPVIADDQKTGAITLDGAPFFPIGLFNVRPDYFKELAAAGFNLVHSDTTCCGETELMLQEQFLDTAQYYGLRVFLPAFHPQELIVGGDQDAIQETIHAIEHRANHPALLFWYTFDDPELHDQNPLFCGKVKEFMGRTDARHPTALMISQQKAFVDYAASADWLITGPYPLPYFPVEYFRDHVRAAVAAAGGRRPVLATIQVHDWTPYFTLGQGGAALTEKAIYNMAHQAVASGARGVLFHGLFDERFNISYEPDLMARLKRVASDLSAHAPYFLLPDAASRPVMEPAGATVDIVLKEDKNAYYLFLVNYRAKHYDLSLDLSALRLAAVETLPHYLEPELYVALPGKDKNARQEQMSAAWDKETDTGLRNRLRKFTFEKNTLRFQVEPLDVWWFRLVKPKAK